MSELSINDMKPTAKPVKDQEMAIRRAYELNAELIDALDHFGSVSELIENHRWVIMRSLKLRKTLDYGTPQWKYPDVWEWTVRHWYSGALKRSVVASMQNITTINKKNIKTKVSELYG